MSERSTGFPRRSTERSVLIVLGVAAVVAVLVASLQPYLRQAGRVGELTSFYPYERTTADMVTQSGYDFVVSDPMTMYSVEGLTLIPGIAKVRRWIRTSEYTVEDQEAFDRLWHAAKDGVLGAEICSTARARGFTKVAFVVTPRTERWLLLDSPAQPFVVARGPELNDAPMVATSQFGPPVSLTSEVQVFDVRCP